MTAARRTAAPRRVEEMTSNDFYLDRNAHFSHHEEMLKDHVRTLAYRNAIMNNTHLFKDKIVLDIGCGMGLRSMLAARAGAAKVIGVDCSNMVYHAREIVNANRFGHSITLIRGKVEAIELPDGIQQVDIIISDWMGQSLFNGTMLSAVIYARNKWLKPKVGLMFPDRLVLFLAAIEAREQKDEKINWWNDVYGFDMSAIRKDAINEPLAVGIDPGQIVTNCDLVKEINMYTVVWQDCNFRAPFRLVAQRNDFVQALLTFFNVEFFKFRQPVVVSAAPECPFTQWQQMVFFLDELLTVKSGEQCLGTFAMKFNGRKKNRELEIDVDVRFEGELSTVVETGHYRMQS